MGLIDSITVADNAPETFRSQADFTRWIPNAVRSAYARRRWINQSVDNAMWGDAFAQGITLADVRARVPHAFAGDQPTIGPDPIIATWGDAYRTLTDDQISLWLFYAGKATLGQPHNGRELTEAALRAGTGTARRSHVLRFIRFAAGDGQYGTRPGGVKLDAGDFKPLEEARELGDLNRHLAGKFFQSLMDKGPAAAERRKFLRDFAIQAGGNPSATDQQLAAVATAYTAEVFTARGIAFDEASEAAQAQGNNLNAETLTGSAITISAQAAPTLAPNATAGFYTVHTAPAEVLRGSAGIGDSFKRLVRHPLKWFRNVLKEVGKGIAGAAGAILDAADDAPWLRDYLLKPLFWHTTLEVLRQFGNVLIEGSISAFDEKKVAASFGSALQIAGTIALAIAPLLPAPWNVIVLAIGAVCVAAGTAIMRYQAEQEAIKQREAEIKQIEAYEKEQAAARKDAEAELALLEAEAAEAAALAEAAENERAALSLRTMQAEGTSPARAALYAAAAGLALAALVLSTSR